MRTAELCTSQIGVILDDAGKPCAGGLLWFLDEAASTPRNIWSRDGDALRNPLPLGSDGCLTVQPYLEQGNYSLRLYKPTNPGAVYDPDDFPNGDWALVRTWLAAGAVPQTQLNGLSVEGVDGLKNLSVEDFAPGTAVIVDGYYQRGDCEARVFVLREGIATPDDATIVEALGGGAYWEWTPGGTLDARSFGAVPDGIRDVSGALTALAAYAAAHSCAVVLPAGTYLVGGEGSVSFRHLSIQDGVSFVNGAAGSLYKIAVTGSIDCLLSAPLRNAGSAGKVLLDFTDAPSDLRARTLWNEGWGETDGSLDADVVNWAPTSGTLRLSGGEVALGQDVARIEVEADTDVCVATGSTPTINELVSSGGRASFVNGSFTFGKCFSSGATLSGATFSGRYFVDEDTSIDYRFNGATLVGAGGLAALNLTGLNITLAGVESDGPIFGTITGGTTPPKIIAAPFDTLKAFHFSDISTINAFASLYENSTNMEVDLGGRSTFAELKGVFVQNSATIRNGTVLIPASASFTYPLEFEDCHLVVANGATFNVSLSLSRCEVNGPVNVPTGAAITALDCTFKNRIALTGDMGDTLLLRNTYTGAGAALDASGVTSWTGHAQVSDNSPEAVTRSPVSGYWPQTEGAARANPSGGASSSVNFGDAGTPHPGILYTGTTDAVLIPSSIFGRAVKVSGSTATNIKVETVDGASFASGDIVSVYFNYSR